MKIKSIQLSNFGCYKGTHPTIDFSINNDKNVTVILGANKSGKTTLVQAFLWCLYGNISPKNGVINSEIRAEMDILSSYDVFVEIILIHADKEYTIRRAQRFYNSSGTVKSDETILRIQYKEANGEQQSIPLRDCVDTVKSILPEGLSDYFFYQGERFVDIKKRDVATAVRGLMGLDAISEVRTHLDPKSAKSVTSKFKKELSLGNPLESDRLKQNLLKSQQEHERIMERIETLKKEYEFYLRRKEELEEGISKNSLAKSLQDKRKILENDIKFGEENIKDAAKQILSHFRQGALSFFALPLINNALEAIENSRQTGEGIPEMRQSAIDHILKRNRCICGCDLRENEGARKHILTERSLLPPEHLGTLLYNHKQTLLGYLDNSKGFLKETNENYKTWRKNIRFLDEKNEELGKISEELISTGSIDVERLELDFQKNEIKLSELSKLRDKLLEDKGAVEHEIKNIENKITSSVDKTDRNKKLQQYIACAEILFHDFDLSYSKREQEVKDDLNESVNRIFSEMYHGHRIVLIDDNYQIKLLTAIGAYQEEVDDTGGLRAVKNFAYISGLVDIARKRVNKENEDEANDTEPYPLIMDAPFSATDEKHIENISKIIPGIAEQVIIIVMQKDWAYAKTAIEAKIGKSYTIENIGNSETSSKIIEGENYV